MSSSKQQKVDVVGKTKGKGFAGVMKRHGFKGVGASHGQHKNHRKPGSIGGASYPARVFKGMRMAGKYGRSTSHYLEPDYPGCGRREQCPADQGRNPRSQGRRCSGSYRCEGSLIHHGC